MPLTDNYDAQYQIKLLRYDVGYEGRYKGINLRAWSGITRVITGVDDDDGSMVSKSTGLSTAG